MAEADDLAADLAAPRNENPKVIRWAASSAHAGVARFDALQGGAGREGALGHHRHRELTAQPGGLDVGSQLLKGSADGGRGASIMLASKFFNYV